MAEPYYDRDGITVHHGDGLDVLAGLPDASVDAVVTDPPYGLEFMGKDWDSPWKHDGAVIRDPATERGGFQDGNGGNPYSRSRIEYGRGGQASVGFQEWCLTWTAECLRILKPGGHLLAFGGTRTWHRLAVAVEDAGFEIRDSIAWMYGSGFPKSLDVSKAIDKAAGAERPVLETIPDRWAGKGDVLQRATQAGAESVDITAPATDAAHTWQGWGTALKPAFEPIVVARKPLAGTVAANVLAHGTGALNIDGCRVEGGPRPLIVSKSEDSTGILGDGLNGSSHGGSTTSGRWPANVILDESQSAALDEQSGESVSRANPASDGRTQPRSNTYGAGHLGVRDPSNSHTDAGGASRFFYTSKADAAERPKVNGTAHPTVKPLSLMQWLVRLVTPPGGVVLEPFAGSGTTVEACILEGFDCIAIEREADYLPLIEARITRRRDPARAVELAGEDMGLLGLLGEEPA